MEYVKTIILRKAEQEDTADWLEAREPIAALSFRRATINSIGSRSYKCQLSDGRLHPLTVFTCLHALSRPTTVVT